MKALRELHYRFLQDVQETSKLDDDIHTLLPTCLFLISTFLLIFLQVHQYTSRNTRWKTRIHREAVFQWTFFYVSRVWFFFIRICKLACYSMDNYISRGSKSNDYLKKTLVHLGVFLLLLMIAMVPLLILSFRFMYTRSIPDFLIWVGDDPMTRSELGTSGHVLERAFYVQTYKIANSAYRSRRSTSVDTNLCKDRYGMLRLRNCRSMITLNDITSNNEL